VTEVSAREPAEPPVVILVAVAENGVIGRDGDMPWRLSTDLKRFKARTLGKPVIMGRRTFASIGRPLPGRDIVVVTRDLGFAVDGVTVAASPAEAVAAARRIVARTGAGEIVVAGGGEIYRALMDVADRLVVTHVHARPDGDVGFPPVDPAVWREVAREGPVQGERDSAPVSFVEYVRISRDAGARETEEQ
jgi:dihydrofolate reductase